MELSDPIQNIKGIGEAASKLLTVLGIRTVSDLIHNYPRTYNDYSSVDNIRDIKPGYVTIKGVIKQSTGKYVRRGIHITEAVASDETGSVRLVWFNQPYRSLSLVPGTTYFISGNFELSHQKFAIMNPACEKETDFPINTARIIPIYRETKGLKSSLIRKTIKQLSSLILSLPETLPEWILEDQKLMSRSKAIFALHFPQNAKNLEEAKRRLGFEEIFELTLAALLNKNEQSSTHALQIPFNKKIAQTFVKNLPFILTDDQKKVIWQIFLDLGNERPMNRLIEGDVGSGKTVVAAMSALMALEQQFQVAFMAPTELLARQHADTIYNLLKPLKLEDRVGLLVGGMKLSNKKQVYEHIKTGHVRFIIGTHALIQEKVDMHKLGLVIIDEQHRFGVEQRKKLLAKAGHMPHVLSMTATPIPRSLALTLYGELDISIISTKPADRLPILTKITSPNSTKELYDSVDMQISTGRQVFIVCPLVVESSNSTGLHSAEETYKKLSAGPFKHRRVALLHGKMKPTEKNIIMEDFVAHKYDILVSTTVIEVGVDVPNATVMIIQNVDRFGLAQLHQLRGRVGRSSHQGYCYGVLSDSKPATKRLRAFERTNDGFKLAELDLELRGPGAIYGTMQHGQLDLRVAKLTDVRLIENARNSAQEFINRNERLVQYKHLAFRVKNLQAVTNLN